MKPFGSRAGRITALTARMLLGLFFVVSAIAKLLDIDNFEIYLFSYQVLSLGMSQVVARVLIVLELLVGVGLIANVWNRFVDCCAVLMIAAFSLFLCYAIWQGRHDSCQCMGSLLQINPTLSLLKNACLLLVLLLAMKGTPWQWSPRWYLWVPAIVLPWVAVFCISAPDSWLFGPAEEQFNDKLLERHVKDEGMLAPLQLDEGRHVVVFLTPGCPFCRMTDEKLRYICGRDELDSNAIVYIVPGGDTLQTLGIDSISYPRMAYQLNLDTFMHITYGNRPIVMLVDDGKVKASCHYRNIDERQIGSFLKP